ncbi:MAG: hypothetical protein QM744_15050 [Mesorhizobium sp.]
MNTILKLCAILLGSALGTLIFLVLVIFVVGDPLTDWLRSSLGIVFSAEPRATDPLAREAAIALMERGLITTPDSLISTISNLYGNMIQILVGAFALLAILSFFAICWQSIQQAEAFLEEKIEKSLNSTDFNKRLNDITIETFDTYYGTNIGSIDQRLSILEDHIAKAASDQEPEE